MIDRMSRKIQRKHRGLKTMWVMKYTSWHFYLSLKIWYKKGKEKFENILNLAYRDISLLFQIGSLKCTLRFYVTMNNTKEFKIVESLDREVICEHSLKRKWLWSLEILIISFLFYFWNSVKFIRKKPFFTRSATFI